MNNLNASTVANNHISRPGPPTVRKVTLILPAYNEEVSTGSITLRSKQHADQVIVIDEGSTDRTAEVAELAGAEIKIKPQIHSPPEELSACYARGRAGNADERRYELNDIINIFRSECTTRNHRTHSTEAYV